IHQIDPNPRSLWQIYRFIQDDRSIFDMTEVSHFFLLVLSAIHNTKLHHQVIRCWHLSLSGKPRLVYNANEACALPLRGRICPMLFSARLPVASLIELCRALRHNLSAGLTLRDVFRQQARQGTGPVRPLAECMRRVIERGEDLETALMHESKAFPPLFLALASVGERSGNLPEVFAALEKYYIMQQRMWRQFISLSIWPAFQLIAAIFVIAAMLLLIGILNPQAQGAFHFDPLGIGTGPKAALRFLVVCFGSIGLLIGGYFLATRSLRHRAAVDRVLLRIPVVGRCLEA